MFPDPDKPLKVLLADDDAVVREVGAAMLRHGGHEVVLAADGWEAVSAFARESPDLVVLDYDMSEMNGDTVARKVRQAYPELPIILFSGCSQEECSPVLSLVDQYVPKGTLSPLRHTIAILLAPEQQNPSTC